jgi:crossover junction endodeoxyribonuclease RuvC
VSWIPEPPEPSTTRNPVPRILGVDPGSLITGWGLIGGTAGRPAWLDAGVIRLGTPTNDLADRLCRLQREMEQLVLRAQPTCAAVEAAYHGVNARSALHLAHSRGVVLAVLAGAGLEIHEYTPATVKKAVTGNGRAPKEQVRTMVGHLLRRSLPPASGDLSDALAVALCHAGQRRNAALTAGSSPRRR